MGKYFINIAFLLSGMATIAQADDFKAALKKLQNAKEDTSKVSLLLNIERKYFIVDLDSALYYNNLCEKLINKINAQQYKHKCYHDFVKIYHAKNEYKNALNYCLKSIKVAEQNNERFQEATSYRAISNLYHNLKMNDSAVKYAIHSIKLTIEIGDTSNIATNYGNLCWLYMDLFQYDKASNYGLKGVQAGEHYADTVGLLICINNLALCYLRTNIYDKAAQLLKRQLHIGKTVKRVRSVRNALINLATVYFNTGDVAALEENTAALNDYNSKDAALDEKNKALQNIPMCTILF